jgi:hypothetical protein
LLFLGIFPYFAKFCKFFFVLALKLVYTLAIATQTPRKPKMTNPTIKHRYTGAVLFEGEAGMTTRQMLEKATENKVILYGASLDGASLNGASLNGARLVGASLDGASLVGASLDRASLDGASLVGAILSFGKAIGSRPYFAIGPIGSRCDYAKLWITDKGPFVQAGCFTGTLDEFAVECIKTHGDTDHGKEYAMAVLMFEAHANLWTPNQLEIAK